MPADSWKLAPGLNHVGSYQVSGKPFVSGGCIAPISGTTPMVVRFPYLTKWVTVQPKQTMNSRELRVAFSKNGLYGKGTSDANGGYNFRIHMSSSLRGPLDLKVSELWFLSEDNAVYHFDVVAGLTNIPSSRVDTIDRTVNGTVEAGGPNWSGSLGVG